MNWLEDNYWIVAVLMAFASGVVFGMGLPRKSRCPDLTEARATLTACEQTVRECSRAIHADEREITFADGLLLNP